MSVNVELKEYVKDKKELTKSKGCQWKYLGLYLVYIY